MGKSKETFMEQREQEMENSLPTNWVEHIPYPWLKEKREEPAREVGEKPDDPVGEHEEREWKAAVEKN